MLNSWGFIILALSDWHCVRLCQIKLCLWYLLLFYWFLKKYLGIANPPPLFVCLNGKCNLWKKCCSSDFLLSLFHSTYNKEICRMFMIFLVIIHVEYTYYVLCQIELSGHVNRIVKKASYYCTSSFTLEISL